MLLDLKRLAKKTFQDLERNPATAKQTEYVIKLLK
jgi:hypothetical protein